MRERFSARSSCPTSSSYGVTYWNYVGEPVHYVLGASRSSTAATRNDPRRSRAQSEEPLALRGRQRRRPARHRPVHDAGSGSRTCSSSTARPRRRSARSVARAIRAAASARSPSRREDPRPSAAQSVRPPSSTPTARSSTTSSGRRDLPRRRRHRPLPGLLRQPGRQHHQVSATASTTPAISGTCSCATASASSSSTAAPTTGSARTARTSRPRQVARLLQEHPDVVLAAAYGVPCAVSDELVMAALKLRDGARFDPQGVLRLLRAAGDGRQHGPQVVPRLHARGRRVRVHADRKRSWCGT